MSSWNYLTELLPNGHKIIVDYDEYPENPRTFSESLGTVIDWSRSRYSMGADECVPCFKTYMADNGINHHTAFILPVYAYIHSGTTINTTGFSCRWDSGQKGFIYVLKSDVRKEYGVKRISPKLKETVLGVLRAEIAELDTWLRGEVFTYTLLDKDDNVIDSYGGIYGTDYLDTVLAKTRTHYLLPAAA